MRRLRHLTGQHRTPSLNRLFGGVLAVTTAAAMTVVLVNWARSEYALSLLLEAMRMLMLLLALSLPLLFADFYRILRRKVKAIQQSS